MLGVGEGFVMEADWGSDQRVLAVQTRAGYAPRERVADAAGAGKGTRQVIHSRV